jgi:haloacetate dehalogenase
LFLWSRHGDVEVLFDDPLAIWKPWAENLRGFSIDSGSQMAEENPDAVVKALTEFLSDVPEQAPLPLREAQDA